MSACGRKAFGAALAVGLVLIFRGIASPQEEPGFWKLTEEPVFSVGAVMEPEHEVFGEVADVARLSSGTIVVADRQAGELRFFDPGGKLLRRVGRRGEGPREFIYIISMERCRGDSLVMLDSRRSYLPVWSPEGTFGRTIDLTGLPSDASEYPLPRRFACNDRGTLALVGRSPPSLSRLRGGPIRRDLPIVLLRRDGIVLELGHFRGDEHYVHPGPEGRTTSLGPRPLGKRLSVALGDSLIYVGTGDAYEVTLFSLDGERMGTLRDSVEPVPIREEVVDAYIEGIVSRLEDERARREARAAYREFEYPDRAPAYLDLLAGRDGHFWIEAFRLPGEPSLWRVYGPGGERVATVEMPPRFELKEAGEDYVLGVWRDANDVKYVHMYGLVKQPEGG